MTHAYIITGLTCGGCVAKPKSELLKLGGLLEAEMQLASPQATIKMQQHNLPLNSIAIIEDSVMILMSLAMLIMMI